MKINFRERSFLSLGLCLMLVLFLGALKIHSSYSNDSDLYSRRGLAYLTQIVVPVLQESGALPEGDINTLPLEHESLSRGTQQEMIAIHYPEHPTENQPQIRISLSWGPTGFRVRMTSQLPAQLLRDPQLKLGVPGSGNYEVMSVSRPEQASPQEGTPSVIFVDTQSSADGGSSGSVFSMLGLGQPTPAQTQSSRPRHQAFAQMRVSESDLDRLLGPSGPQANQAHRAELIHQLRGHLRACFITDLVFHPQLSVGRFAGTSIRLSDPQREALAGILDLRQRAFRTLSTEGGGHTNHTPREVLSTLLVQPTGTGKTVILTEALRQMTQAAPRTLVVFVVPSQYILRDTSTKMAQQLGLSQDQMAFVFEEDRQTTFADLKNRGAQLSQSARPFFVFTTDASLSAQIDDFKALGAHWITHHPDGRTIMVLDEAQHAGAETVSTDGVDGAVTASTEDSRYQRILDAMDSMSATRPYQKEVIGMTATPLHGVTGVDTIAKRIARHGVVAAYVDPGHAVVLDAHSSQTQRDRFFSNVVPTVTQQLSNAMGDGYLAPIAAYTQVKHLPGSTESVDHLLDQARTRWSEARAEARPVRSRTGGRRRGSPQSQSQTGSGDQAGETREYVVHQGVIDVIREHVLQVAQEHAPSRVLVFTANQDEAEAYAQAFNRSIGAQPRALRAGYYHSGSPQAQEGIQWFRENVAEHRVLFVVNGVNEGVDIPEVTGLINMTKVRSIISLLQRLGRATRPGTLGFDVLDFTGAFRRVIVPLLGSGFVDHSTESSFGPRRQGRGDSESEVLEGRRRSGSSGGVRVIIDGDPVSATQIRRELLEHSESSSSASGGRRVRPQLETQMAQIQEQLVYHDDAFRLGGLQSLLEEALRRGGRQLSLRSSGGIVHLLKMILRELSERALSDQKRKEILRWLDQQDDLTGMSLQDLSNQGTSPLLEDSEQWISARRKIFQLLYILVLSDQDQGVRHIDSTLVSRGGVSGLLNHWISPRVLGPEWTDPETQNLLEYLQNIRDTVRSTAASGHAEFLGVELDPQKTWKAVFEEMIRSALVRVRGPSVVENLTRDPLWPYWQHFLRILEIESRKDLIGVSLAGSESVFSRVTVGSALDRSHPNKAVVKALGRVLYGLRSFLEHHGHVYSGVQAEASHHVNVRPLAQRVLHTPSFLTWLDQTMTSSGNEPHHEEVLHSSTEGSVDTIAGPAEGVTRSGQHSISGGALTVSTGNSVSTDSVLVGAVPAESSPSEVSQAQPQAQEQNPSGAEASPGAAASEAPATASSRSAAAGSSLDPGALDLLRQLALSLGVCTSDDEFYHHGGLQKVLTKLTHVATDKILISTERRDIIMSHIRIRAPQVGQGQPPAFSDQSGQELRDNIGAPIGRRVALVFNSLRRHLAGVSLFSGPRPTPPGGSSPPQPGHGAGGADDNEALVTAQDILGILSQIHIPTQGFVVSSVGSEHDPGGAAPSETEPGVVAGGLAGTGIQIGAPSVLDERWMLEQMRAEFLSSDIRELAVLLSAMKLDRNVLRGQPRVAGRGRSRGYSLEVGQIFNSAINALLKLDEPLASLDLGHYLVLAPRRDGRIVRPSSEQQVFSSFNSSPNVAAQRARQNLLQSFEPLNVEALCNKIKSIFERLRPLFAAQDGPSSLLNPEEFVEWASEPGVRLALAMIERSPRLDLVPEKKREYARGLLAQIQSVAGSYESASSSLRTLVGLRATVFGRALMSVDYGRPYEHGGRAQFGNLLGVTLLSHLLELRTLALEFRPSEAAYAVARRGIRNTLSNTAASSHGGRLPEADGITAAFYETITQAGLGSSDLPGRDHVTRFLSSWGNLYREPHQKRAFLEQVLNEPSLGSGAPQSPGDRLGERQWTENFNAQSNPEVARRYQQQAFLDFLARWVQRGWSMKAVLDPASQFRGAVPPEPNHERDLPTLDGAVSADQILEAASSFLGAPLEAERSYQWQLYAMIRDYVVAHDHRDLPVRIRVSEFLVGLIDRYRQVMGPQFAIGEEMQAELTNNRPQHIEGLIRLLMKVLRFHQDSEHIGAPLARLMAGADYPGLIQGFARALILAENFQRAHPETGIRPRAGHQALQPECLAHLGDHNDWMTRADAVRERFQEALSRPERPVMAGGGAAERADGGSLEPSETHAVVAAATEGVPVGESHSVDTVHQQTTNPGASSESRVEVSASGGGDVDTRRESVSINQVVEPPVFPFEARRARAEENFSQLFAVLREPILKALRSLKTIRNFNWSLVGGTGDAIDEINSRQESQALRYIPAELDRNELENRVRRVVIGTIHDETFVHQVKEGVLTAAQDLLQVAFGQPESSGPTIDAKVLFDLARHLRGPVLNEGEEAEEFSFQGATNLVHRVVRSVGVSPKLMALLQLGLGLRALALSLEMTLGPELTRELFLERERKLRDFVSIVDLLLLARQALIIQNPTNADRREASERLNRFVNVDRSDFISSFLELIGSHSVTPTAQSVIAQSVDTGFFGIHSQEYRDRLRAKILSIYTTDQGGDLARDLVRFMSEDGSQDHQNSWSEEKRNLLKILSESLTQCVVALRLKRSSLLDLSGQFQRTEPSLAGLDHSQVIDSSGRVLVQSHTTLGSRQSGAKTIQQWLDDFEVYLPIMYGEQIPSFGASLRGSDDGRFVFHEALIRSVQVIIQNRSRAAQDQLVVHDVDRDTMIVFLYKVYTMLGHTERNNKGHIPLTTTRLFREIGESLARSSDSEVRALAQPIGTREGNQNFIQALNSALQLRRPVTSQERTRLANSLRDVHRRLIPDVPPFTDEEVTTALRNFQSTYDAVLCSGKLK